MNSYWFNSSKNLENSFSAASAAFVARSIAMLFTTCSHVHRHVMKPGKDATFGFKASLSANTTLRFTRFSNLRLEMKVNYPFRFLYPKLWKKEKCKTGNKFSWAWGGDIRGNDLPFQWLLNPIQNQSHLDKIFPFILLSPWLAPPLFSLYNELRLMCKSSELYAACVKLFSNGKILRVETTNVLKSLRKLCFIHI